MSTERLEGTSQGMEGFGPGGEEVEPPTSGHVASSSEILALPSVETQPHTSSPSEKSSIREAEIRNNVISDRQEPAPKAENGRFSTFVPAAPDGLRRFSHPTQPVSPLLNNKSGSKDASFDSMSEEGRGFASEFGASLASLLDFFRNKLDSIERNVANIVDAHIADIEWKKDVTNKLDTVLGLLSSAAQEIQMGEHAEIAPPLPPTPTSSPMPGEKIDYEPSGYEGSDSASAQDFNEDFRRADQQTDSISPWDAHFEAEGWTPLLESEHEDQSADHAKSAHIDIFEELEGIQPEQTAPQPLQPTAARNIQFPKAFDVRRRFSVSAESFSPDQAIRLDEASVPKPAYIRARLRDIITQEALFRRVDLKNIEDVVDAMRPRPAKPDEVVIRQGDLGDEMFLIDEGYFDVLYGDQVVATLGPGKLFGEISLMYNCPRTATIKSKNSGLLWAVDRRTFRLILMQDSIQKRERNETFLKKVKLFSSLLPYERGRIADALESVSFSDGEVIIRQGDASDDRFFVIERGEVEFWKASDEDLTSKPAFCGRAKRGDYFGELSLLTARPRQATVIARGDVSCLTMKREDFVRVMGPCEDILRRNSALYESYQQILQRERTSETQPFRPCICEEELPITEIFGSIDRFRSLAADFWLPTSRRALQVCKAARAAVDSQHRTFNLVSELRAPLIELKLALYKCINTLDAIGSNQQISEEDHATQSVKAINDFVQQIPVFDSIAQDYYALLTARDCGCFPPEVATVLLSQDKLDLIETLLSHPYSVRDAVSDVKDAACKTSVSQEAKAIAVDALAKMDSLLDDFKHAKEEAVKVFTAMLECSKMRDLIGIEPKRRLCAEINAILVSSDENNATNTPVKSLVFNDFLVTYSPEQKIETLRSLPLRGSVLHLDEDHRAHVIYSSSSDHIEMNFQLPEEQTSSEWIVKLRDAVEEANSSSPNLFVPLPPTRLFG